MTVAANAKTVRRARLPFVAAILAAVATVDACSSSPSNSTTTLCTPGRSVACTSAGGCAGGQVCGSDGSSFGPCICQGSTSNVIGPSGGVVSGAGGASVTLPPGAVSAPTTITVTVLSSMPPSAYEACSLFYQFGPAGLIFQVPVFVTLPDHGCASSSALYWSKLGQSGYDRLQTTLAASSASAQVTHFSTGFVGRLAPQGQGPDAGSDSTIDSTLPPDSAEAGREVGTDSALDSSPSDSSTTDTGVDAPPPPCTGPSSCPAGQACGALGVCSTSCSATSPCNGGCCDGTTCQPGTSSDACGLTGAACTMCSSPTPACGASGTCVLCAAASDCPSGQACSGGTCSTACSASTPCNGGCCDGTMCQPGNAVALCGTTGGACASCSGSTPFCNAGSCAECGTATDCPSGLACYQGTCSSNCTDSPCNGVCCYDGCCFGSEISCRPAALQVCNQTQSAACNVCSPTDVCTAAGACGCSPTDPSGGAVACPASTICSASTGECETTPPGSCSGSVPCSGGVCCTSSGTCGTALSPTTCGVFPETCIDCTAPTRCGAACTGSSCGCHSNSDCTSAQCTSLGTTVCDLATYQCAAPDGGAGDGG
jgi:hypothetical protein